MELGQNSQNRLARRLPQNLGSLLGKSQSQILKAVFYDCVSCSEINVRVHSYFLPSLWCWTNLFSHSSDMAELRNVLLQYALYALWDIRNELHRKLQRIRKLSSVHPNHGDGWTQRRQWSFRTRSHRQFYHNFHFLLQLRAHRHLSGPRTNQTSQMEEKEVNDARDL